MIQIEFAASFKKHVDVESVNISALSVRDALQQAFGQYPELRTYVLDDQGAVRKHVTIFVNGKTVADREGLTDALAESDQVFVFQALSGG